MSFGCGVDDVLALIQLSWSAVEGATRACGKHDDLTKEVSSLYDVLAHVYSELSVPESSIGRARTSSKAELQSHLAGCDTQIRIVNSVLDKFNALSPDQRFGKQLWSKVRFANGEDQDLTEIRLRMATYSTAITMLLRLMALGSRGKIERQLSRQKGSLLGIRESVNVALARINSTTRQQSVMMAYSNDSKQFWSRLRRELTKDGFSRSGLNLKKDLILSYMKELDSRGALGYSTSFQKAMKSKNESKRQANTPASFQSSSTLTCGRDSNSSLLFNSKDSGYGSSSCDIRTEDDDPCWSDSRPVTAIEPIEECDIVPGIVRVESPEEYTESPSPPIPYRVRSEPDPAVEPRSFQEPPFSTSTQQPIIHSPSHDSPRPTLSRYTSRTEAEQKIKLEDPNGREFCFPLSQAKSWEGMENLIKKSCAGIGSGLVDAHHDGTNLLPYLWEEMAEPGAKLTIRRPCVPSQPSVHCPPSEKFYLMPERPLGPEEEDFSHLPTLGDWMQSGITEFTPHSEFYEMD